MARTAVAVLAVMGVVLAGCTADEADEPTAADTQPTSTTVADAEPPAASTTVADGELRLGDVETVAEGLEVPWGLAFVDETTMLVTERAGRVRLVRDGRLQPDPVLELDIVDRGEGGLLGIALHPQFGTDRFAYLYYTAPSGNRVSRFPVSEALRFGPEEVLVDGIPAARFHDGGRIHFGPDGMLYVTTGDAQQPALAADANSLAGKFLRVLPDGAGPADNPFGDSPVFSYGHRNAQGFDWDDEGRLYASEHGPTGELGLCCHDELNLVGAGEFFGWPFVAGEAAAASGDPPEDPTAPIAASGTDTWAPAGVAVHDPDSGPTSILVATLAAEQVLRFVLDEANPSRVARTEVAVDGFGRMRAAAFGPDGCLYLTTSNTDGRGDPAPNDDRVLRSCPQAAG